MPRDGDWASLTIRPHQCERSGARQRRDHEQHCRCGGGGFGHNARSHRYSEGIAANGGDVRPTSQLGGQFTINADKPGTGPAVGANPSVKGMAAHVSAWLGLPARMAWTLP